MTAEARGMRTIQRRYPQIVLHIRAPRSSRRSSGGRSIVPTGKPLHFSVAEVAAHRVLSHSTGFLWEVRVVADIIHCSTVRHSHCVSPTHFKRPAGIPVTLRPLSKLSHPGALKCCSIKFGVTSGGS